MFGIPYKKDEAIPKYAEDTVDEYTPHVQSKKDVIDATFRGNQARYLNHSCDVMLSLKVAKLCIDGGI